VIGHSHGGNVLLGAMSDSIAERLCGVVCLSTPFLSVQRRPSRLLFNSIIVAFYFLSLSLALVVLCVIENALGVSLRINNYIMIPIFFYIDDVGKRLRRFCQAYIDGLEPLIRVPGSITSCRLLIVRSAADEATAALLSAQFARWLLQMFSKTFLEKIPDKLNLRLKQLFSPMSKFKIITLVVLSIYGSALAALFLDAQRLQVLGIGILVTFVGTPVILSLLFLLLSLCCAFCGLILMLPIGFDAMLASLLLEISAETTPSGIWTIYQANVSLSGPRLRHSSPQDEDICLKFIAEWMAQST